jgi:hypothetical protein
MSAIVAPAGTILTPSGQPAWIEAVKNNWYEGSRWSPNRSFVWFPVQDAKRDLDRFTRYELSRHARYLWKNSPFMRGLTERLVTLVIGSGFHPVFKSSNPKWNTRAKAIWAKKSRNIHLGSRCSMLQYQRCIARARFVDGECFSLKTDDETINFASRIQGIEADRICGINPKDKQVSKENQEFNHNNSGGVDGFNLNRQGIVTSYNIRGVDQPYDAENIIHHFSPNRVGQYRGETIFAAAINTARDIDDILSLEKQCVKDASGRKDIIKTASGQLDSETFRSLRYGANGAAGQFPTVFSLPGDVNAHDDYYNVKFGAESIVLRHGDEYTPYVPDRPGNAWMGFMDFLSQTICLSSGLPPSVVLPIRIGGTDIRRDLDITQKVIDPWQMDIAAELDELLQYLMEEEIQDGALRQDCPQDWDYWVWHFPPKVNVDRGQAKEDRADVAAGLMSLEEYHGRYGEDYEAIEASVVREAAKRKENIAAAGFESVKEFLQVLSLNPMLFSQEAGKPEPDKEEVAA